MSFNISQSNKFIKSGIVQTNIQPTNNQNLVLLREEIIKKKVIDPKTGKNVIKKFKRKVYKKGDQNAETKHINGGFGVKTAKSACIDYY